MQFQQFRGPGWVGDLQGDLEAAVLRAQQGQQGSQIRRGQMLAGGDKKQPQAGLIQTFGLSLADRRPGMEDVLPGGHHPLP